MYIFESNSISKYTKTIIVRLIKLKDEVEAFMFFLNRGGKWGKMQKTDRKQFQLNIQINKCKKKILIC